MSLSDQILKTTKAIPLSTAVETKAKITRKVNKPKKPEQVKQATSLGDNLLNLLS